RVPEPLECGLPAGAEHITDLPPALPGSPGTVDGCLQRRFRDGRQISCRRDLPRPGPILFV
ncbi:MAG: hypothetical protein ABSB59_41565, partial [Streptosporangiaceae bacterium]